MEAYTDFASVYDTFMDETPYEEWKKRLLEICDEYNLREGLGVDLGCGTGIMTELLSQSGFDMIGIDNSNEMLSKAIAKKEDKNLNILYLCQDMREFELYGTVKVIFSICDCMNYLLEPNEIIQVMKLANNYLDPRGCFIFDFNTLHKYKDIIGDTTIAENRDDCSFIWENYFYEEDHINEYELTLFLKDQSVKNDVVYRKSTETHYQRGYTLEEITQYAKMSGLKVLAAYDEYSKQPANENSERILMVLQEQGK